jgi:hypothetical protein
MGNLNPDEYELPRLSTRLMMSPTTNRRLSNNSTSLNILFSISTGIKYALKTESIQYSTKKTK